MEAIRISCAGYPTRKTFDDFLRRFGILAPDILDGRYLCVILFSGFAVLDSHLTKLYFSFISAMMRPRLVRSFLRRWTLKAIRYFHCSALCTAWACNDNQSWLPLFFVWFLQMPWVKIPGRPPLHRFHFLLYFWVLATFEIYHFCIFMLSSAAVSHMLLKCLWIRVRQKTFDPSLLQIGKTKVFLRAGQMAELDGYRSEVLGRSASIIQRNVRSYLSRKSFILLRLSAIQIQALCRGTK